MRRLQLAILCLAVPGLIFLNAWEGYRYNTLADQVAGLENEQKDLLEGNRDAIAQIAYETSPETVGRKAAGIQGLMPLDQSAVTRLQVESVAPGGPAR
jgi:hypothetical protein